MDESGKSTEALLKIIRQLSEEIHPYKRNDASVTLDSSLGRDLGIDSLGRVELLHRIERNFDVSLPEQVLISAESPRDLLRALFAAGDPQQTPAEIPTFSQGEVETTPEEAEIPVDVPDRHTDSRPECLYAFYAWVLFLLPAIIIWPIVVIMPKVAWCRSLLRVTARMIIKLSGIRFTVNGLEKLPGEGTCVIVANHCSYIDVIILAAVLPDIFGYVVKRDLFGSFVPRVFLRRIRAEFVERFDIKRILDDADRISQSVSEGKSMVFFPEGTFTRIPGLRPFHMGAFVFAAKAGVPVVPVTIRGTRSILRAQNWFPRRGSVTVTLGIPIMPEGSDWAAAIKMRDSARAEILRHCGEADLEK